MTQTNAVIQGILLGGLYALFATGLSLIFGVMGVVNLAQGVLTLLGAFIALVLVDQLGINPFAAIPAVIALMFAVGYGFQRLLVNRTLGEGVLPPLLVTFGFAIIVENVLLKVFSADSQGLDAGWIEAARIRIGGSSSIGGLPLLIFVTAVTVLAVLQLVVDRTAFGRALRATSDDPNTARLMGIDDRRVYGLAMGTAAAIAGVAGVFMGVRTTFAPLDGPVLLIFAFEAVIIGGLGSLWGTLVGGIILGVAQTLGAQLIAPAWFQLTGHLVFLAILVLRPSGLFPKVRP